MVQQTIFDCVNGIVVKNLGLANPINVYIDVHISQCKFQKVFNAGALLSGVSLSSVRLTDCEFDKCSFGIYLEEVQSYGRFSQLYDDTPIEMKNIHMTQIREAGIAIKSLLANLKINHGSIYSLKRTPILTEDLRAVEHYIRLSEDFSLGQGEIV